MVLVFKQLQIDPVICLVNHFWLLSCFLLATLTVIHLHVSLPIQIEVVRSPMKQVESVFEASFYLLDLDKRCKPANRDKVGNRYLED